MDQLKVGKLIAKLRQERNLTQTELGEKLGVSYKAVSKWERGINMPDVSLFKPLCKILGISVNELVEGEIVDKPNNNKLKKIIIISSLLIVIISIILIYKKILFPKIAIYNIEVISDNQNELVNQILYTDNNIWYYKLKEVKLCNNNKTCYNLGISLNHKQTTINDIKKYLDTQYENDNLKRYILYDGGTTIYKDNKYMVIFCNTTSGNNDIYFGPNNMDELLQGKYCGNTPSKINYFVRTYHILNIYEDNDEDYINVTLKQYQGEPVTVKINKSNNIKVGYNYEFTFYTYHIFDDNINNIFKYATLVKTQITNKVGMEQINEEVKVTE